MKLLKLFYKMLEVAGQTRAATYFARQGNYTAAKEIMSK